LVFYLIPISNLALRLQSLVSMNLQSVSAQPVPAVQPVPALMRFAALALMAFALPALQAQQTVQEPLSLQQAIEMALSRRPELTAAKKSAEAAGQMRKQAGLIPNPRFYYQSENLRSGMDFAQQTDTYIYGSEQIEISGRRGARIAVAESGVNRTRIEADQAERQLRLHVAQAYWEALHQQYVKALAVQNVDIYRETLDYHQKRFQEGKLAEVDLMRVRLEEERAEASAEAAGLAEQQAQLKLAREMGLVTGSWLLTERFEEISAASEAPEAVRERPEILLARQAVETARANLRTQKANGRPDLDLVTGYKRTAGLNTMIAGLQLNVPLFDRNQGAVKAAKFEVEARRASLQAAELQAASEAAAARSACEQWKKRISGRYKPLLDQASGIAEIARQAYREGGSDLLHLLDAERLRLEAQSAWVEALANYHQSVLTLQYTQGMEP
jgi:outer membrane protein TolC